MASLNKVQLIGNLGNDPDVKYTQSGACVTTISIATTEKWKDKDGNPQEKTEWHRVVFWNKLGEIAGEYLRKGSQVYVEGKLTTEKWTDQQGVERYTTKINASEMKMLGGRRDGDNDNGQRQGGQQQRAPRQEYGGGGSGYGQQRPQQQPQQSAPPMDDFADDDIPF